MNQYLRDKRDGWIKNEKGVAKDLYNNYVRKNYECVCCDEDLFGMVDYLNENYSNVNELGVECALECYFYEFVGVYNNNIENNIKKVVEKYVEDGKIIEW